MAKGKHLKYKDRVMIETYYRDGMSIVDIALRASLNQARAKINQPEIDSGSPNAFLAFGIHSIYLR